MSQPTGPRLPRASPERAATPNERLVRRPQLNAQRRPVKDCVLTQRGTDGPTRVLLSDEAKAQRREVIETTEAWRAAEPIRRDHVAGLLAHKTPPKARCGSASSGPSATGGIVGTNPHDLVAEPIVDTPLPATL